MLTHELLKTRDDFLLAHCPAGNKTSSFSFIREYFLPAGRVCRKVPLESSPGQKGQPHLSLLSYHQHLDKHIIRIQPGVTPPRLQHSSLHILRGFGRAKDENNFGKKKKNLNSLLKAKDQSE